MFVGITFIIQAVVLVSLITFRNQQLLYYDNSSAEVLIVDYVQMHTSGGLKRMFFDHGPITVNFPQLREKIEYKIIQDFFIRSYNLPNEFKFANYMCGVLKDYIIALVEIRPVSWLTLAVFAAVNLFRIHFIDPTYQTAVCTRYPGKSHYLSNPDDHNSTSHRMLSGAATDDGTSGPSMYNICEEYTLRYVFVCSILLMFYIMGLMIASEVYMQRLVDKVLDTEAALQMTEEEAEMNRMRSNVADETFGDAEEVDVSDVQLPVAALEFANAYDQESAALNDPMDGRPLPPLPPGRKRSVLGPVASPTPSALPSDETLLNTLSNTPSSAAERFVPKKGSQRKSGSYTAGMSINVGNLGSLNTLAALTEHNKSSTMPLPQAHSAVLPKAKRRMTAAYRAQSYSAAQMAQQSPAMGMLPTNRTSLPRTRPTRQNSMTSRASFNSFEGDKGNIFGDNRRYLYLHCLERIMQGEMASRARDARRFSSSDPSEKKHQRRGSSTVAYGKGLARPPSAKLTAAALNDEVDMEAGLEDEGVDPERIDFRKLKTLRHAYNLKREGSISSYAEEGAGAIGTKKSSFMNTLKAFSPSRSRTPSVVSTASAPPKDGYYHAPAHFEDRLSVAKHVVHHHPPEEHARKRGYSIQFFEMERPSDAPPAEPVLWVSIVQTVLSRLHHISHEIWKTIVGHHLGISSHETKQDEDIKELEMEFEEIFAFRNAELYYFCIEFGLLVQYVYVALWATNFIFMADDSYHTVLWQIALVVPMVCNFLMLKTIIFTSVMLKSIVKLDQRIANDICERATDERVVTQRLKHLLRSNLKTMQIAREGWYDYLFAEFKQVKPTHTDGLNVSDLKRFLHSLQIYITDESMKRIFTVLDTDKDNCVHWERLSEILLPEFHKRKIKLKKKLDKKGRGSIAYEYQLAEGADMPSNRRSSKIDQLVSNLNPFSSKTDHQDPTAATSATDHSPPIQDGISVVRSSSFNVLSAAGSGVIAAIRNNSFNVLRSSSTGASPSPPPASLPAHGKGRESPLTHSHSLGPSAAARLFAMEDNHSAHSHSNSNSVNNSGRHLPPSKDGNGSDEDETASQADRRHHRRQADNVNHKKIMDVLARKHAKQGKQAKGIAEDCDSNHSEGGRSDGSSDSDMSKFTDDQSINSNESDFSQTSQDMRFQEDKEMEDKGVSDRSKHYSIGPPAKVAVTWPKPKAVSGHTRPGAGRGPYVDIGGTAGTDMSAAMMTVEDEEKYDGQGVVVFDKMHTATGKPQGFFDV